MNAPKSATPAAAAPDRLVRWSTIAVVVLVALAAAYVSYRHAYELIHDHGETGAAARIGPGTVDGLIYASGMVLLQAARYRQPAPWLAYAGLWLGIAATIGANVAHGWSHGPLGALVSAWPAVALIFSYELLMRLIRTGAAKGAEPGSDRDGASEHQCQHRPGRTVPDSIVAAFLHERDCLGDEPSQRQLAARFDLDRKKVADLVRPHTEAPPPVDVSSPNGQVPA